MKIVQNARNLALIAVAVGALGGCASITGDASQQVRVDTVTPDGKDVPGASCKLSNDYGTTEGKSGGSIQVHKSSKDLDIRCTQDGKDDATGRSISRANGGMLGNVIFGGGIGAIIDYNKGTGLNYPTWVRLVFGEMRVFDRRDEKEGSAVVGTPPAAASAGATVPAPAPAPATASK